MGRFRLSYYGGLMSLKSHVQQAHDAAERKGQTGYVDPDTGLLVLTAKYLMDRGHCCGAGETETERSPVGRRCAGPPAHLVSQRAHPPCGRAHEGPSSAHDRGSENGGCV